MSRPPEFFKNATQLSFHNSIIYNTAGNVINGRENFAGTSTVAIMETSNFIIPQALIVYARHERRTLIMMRTKRLGPANAIQKHGLPSSLT